MKRKKKDKKVLTFQSGDLNPRFSVIFLPMIWIFMEIEGDEIKSRQGSLKFSNLILNPSHTLISYFESYLTLYFFFQPKMAGPPKKPIMLPLQTRMSLSRLKRSQKKLIWNQWLELWHHVFKILSSLSFLSRRNKWRPLFIIDWKLLIVYLDDLKSWSRFGSKLIFVLTKGQLILEAISRGFTYSKMPTKYFTNICPGQIKNKNTLSYSSNYNVPVIFWFDPF